MRRLFAEARTDQLGSTHCTADFSACCQVWADGHTSSMTKSVQLAFAHGRLVFVTDVVATMDLKDIPRVPDAIEKDFIMRRAGLLKALTDGATCSSCSQHVFGPNFVHHAMHALHATTHCMTNPANLCVCVSQSRTSFIANATQRETTSAYTVNTIFFFASCKNSRR